MNKKLLKRFLSLALALVMVFAVCGCKSNDASETPSDVVSTDQNPDNAAAENTGADNSDSDASDADTNDLEPVRVAVFTSLSGANAASSVFQIQALDCTVEQFNKNGGFKSLGGAPLELVYFDNMSDANTMKTVVENAFEDESISFGVFPLASSYTNPALAAITKSQVPSLTTSQADSIFSQGCDYIYGIGCLSSTQGSLPATYAQYLKDTYNVDTTKIGVVCVDNEYGASMQATYESMFADMDGFEVVYSALYPVDTTDMSSIVTALRQKEVTLLYAVGLDQDSKLLFNTMKSMNYNPLVIGGGSGLLYPSFYEDVGEGMLGIISVGQANPTQSNTYDDELFQELKAMCYEQYGHYGGEFLVTYDTIVDVISQCVEYTGTRDRETNNKAMKELEFHTLFPKLDENGNVPDTMIFDERGVSVYSIPLMLQYQYDDNGELVPHCVYPDQYASVDLLWEN